MLGSEGDNQSALVKLPEEVLQFVEGYFLRREFLFKSFFDFIETVVAVKELKQGVFFFLQAKVPRADGVFENPVVLSGRSLLLGGQVWSKLDRQFSGGAGCEGVGHGGNVGKPGAQAQPERPGILPVLCL